MSETGVKTKLSAESILFIFFAVSLICWSFIRISSNMYFESCCEDYIQRAASASTIEIAKTELTKAVSYLEKNNITSGFTSVLYRTPDEDVSFWFNNLKSSLVELESIEPDALPSEKAIVLLKLNKTLLNLSSGNTSVIVPNGISVYPSNVFVAYMGWLSLIICLISGGSWLLKMD